MTTKLNNFLSKIGEGVKPNMFVVDVNWPSDLASAPSGDNKELVNLLCKSTALPASNIGVIEVPFRGRTVKIAGDRTFDTWTATFFNDKDLKLRSFFEQWANSINTHDGIDQITLSFQNISSTFKDNLNTMMDAIKGSNKKFLYYDGSTYYWMRMARNLTSNEVADDRFSTQIVMNKQLQ